MFSKKNMLKLSLLVFVGGGIGSVARFGLSRLLLPYAVGGFPVGTFGVNILGSLLIGLFWGMPLLADKHNWLLFLTVGLCGGFTTFSAFSWENFNLLRQGHIGLFFVYALLSISLCLLATWGGCILGRNL